MQIRDIAYEEIGVISPNPEVYIREMHRFSVD